MILPFVLRCLAICLFLGGLEHILYEYTVAIRGVGYHHVSDSPHELAVLDAGITRHECGQERTTKFTKKCF